MDIPAESWYEAIFHRRSRRTYSPLLPEKEKISRLEEVCREFRPFPEARAEFVKKAPDDIFRGLIGRYGRVNGAHFFVAFIGRMDSPRVQETVGYTGEGIILEATALGLGTCWVGGFYRPENVKKHISLQEKEQVLSVTPVGYAPKKKDISEKLLSGLARSHKRKPLNDLIQDDVCAPWMEKALDAARLAPSAANRQPWRFSVEKDTITISVGSLKSMSHISKRLDCGIAMLHLEVGALISGIKGGRWEFLPSPQVASFNIETIRTFRYNGKYSGE